ncbi:lectin-like protein [Paraglaciecola sp. L3A3]|uniref:lectin-like protein n=1 Tax=Paraglaciecola sp. L3A3 TaxID=2686358 RepID=UPI00131DD340|nr:lectin-like protein [Paraglaciecola sp. L3A3]
MKNVILFAVLAAISNDVLAANQSTPADRNLSLEIPSPKIKSPEIVVNPNRFNRDNSFSGVYKGKKYTVIFDTTNWHDADAEAKYLGGKLACFDTEDKLTYIHLLRAINGNTKPVWVGLSDQDIEGKWQWSCGQTLHPKMRYWLERGSDLESRDYAHLTVSKGLLSRVNSGRAPDISDDYSTIDKVKGYVVEFDDTFSNLAINPVENAYKLAQPLIYAELMQIRKQVNAWRGEKDTLQQAAIQLEAIVAKDNSFSPAYRELAKVAISKAMINSNYYIPSELAVAEKHLHTAIQLSPKYAQAYITLADMLIKSRRYGEAHVALFNAAKMHADEVSLHLSWGLLQNKKRKRGVALEHYKMVMELVESDSREYRNALGATASLYAGKNDYTKANAAYLELIELNPDDAWIRGNYGAFLFYKVQDIDGSIKASRKALSLKIYGMAKSNLAYGLYTKWAMLKDEQDTVEQAQMYFDEAYELYPNIKYVISKLINYDHTRMTATSLQNWQIQNLSEKSNGSHVEPDKI